MLILPVQTCFPLEQEPWSLTLKFKKKKKKKFGKPFINLHMYYQNYKDLTFSHLY